LSILSIGFAGISYNGGAGLRRGFEDSLLADLAMSQTRLIGDVVRSITAPVK
jgi:hypothetical protein